MLENCPFCNGQAEMLGEYYYWAQCRNCGASTQGSAMIELAEKNWNARRKKMYLGKIKVMLDEGAKMPCKAHAIDAGYDLFARETFTLRAHDEYVMDTGVHIQIPEGYTGFLKSKSGLNVHYGITCEGVIDSGYTGSIKAKLVNSSASPYCFKEGDKVTQLVILPVAHAELEEVDKLENSERGNNGFGSTGR